MQTASTAHSMRATLRPGTPVDANSAAARKSLGSSLRTPPPGLPAAREGLQGLKTTGLVSEAERAAFFAETPRSAQIAALWTPPPMQRRQKGTSPSPSRAATAGRGGTVGGGTAFGKLCDSGGSAVTASSSLERPPGSFWHTLPASSLVGSAVFPSGGSRPATAGSRPATAAAAAGNAAPSSTLQRARGSRVQQPHTAAPPAISIKQGSASSPALTVAPHWQGDSAVARIVSVWEDRATAAAAEQEQQLQQAAEGLAEHCLPHSPQQLAPQPDGSQQQLQPAEQPGSRQQIPQRAAASPVRLWRPQDLLSNTSAASKHSLLQANDAPTGFQGSEDFGGGCRSPSLAASPSAVGSPASAVVLNDDRALLNVVRRLASPAATHSQWRECGGNPAHSGEGNSRVHGQQLQQQPLPQQQPQQRPWLLSPHVQPGGSPPAYNAGLVPPLPEHEEPAQPRQQRQQQQQQQQPPQQQAPHHRQAASGMYPDSILADSIFSGSSTGGSIAGRSMASGCLPPASPAAGWMGLQHEPAGQPHGPVLQSGWLLKARRSGSRRTWRRTWAYLLEDRLCFAPEAAAPQGGSGAGTSVTKYVPLERIPVRGRPRGYAPSPGIAPVDPRLMGTNAGSRRRTDRAGVFSVQCGGRTLFLRATSTAEAEEWILRITDAWVACSGMAGPSSAGSQPPAPQPQQDCHAAEQPEALPAPRLPRQGGAAANRETRQPLAPLQGLQAHADSDHLRRHAEVPPHSGAWEERRPTLPSAYLPAQQLSSPSAARDKKPAQSEGRIAEDPKVAAWPAQQASHRPAHPAAAAAGSQQHAQRQSRSRERSSWSPQRYHVVVRTASARQSRTNGGDARLWLVMHGTRGSGGRHPLDLHDAGWAGSVAHHFTVEDPPLGELAAVTIGLGSGGSGKANGTAVAVQLGSVAVTAPDGRAWYFRGGQQLGIDRSAIVLPASRAPEPQDAAGVTARSGDSFDDSLDDGDAAPDAGDGWQPPWLAATKHGGSTRRPNDSGAAQRAADGSGAQRAANDSVRCDVTSNGSVADTHSRPPTASVQCQTPCHAHVQTDAAATLQMQLAAASSGTAEGASAWPPVSTALLQPAAAGSATDSAGQGLPQAQYRVTVWTADVPGCYAEGRPRIKILGANGRSTGPQPLDNGRSAFERGGVDVCSFAAPDVGVIDRVALAIDPSHPADGSSGWRIKKIEVVYGASCQTATFARPNWLIGVPVLLSQKVGDPLDSVYTTAADAMPSADEGRPAPHEDSHFENQDEADDSRMLPRDHQMVETPPLASGDAPLLDLRQPSATHGPPWSTIEGGGDGGGWGGRAKLGLIGSGDGSEACSGDADSILESEHSSQAGSRPPEMLSEGVGSDSAVAGPAEQPFDYRVSFFTRRRLGAGTSAKVFVELIGPRGTTGPLALPKTRKGFGAGQAAGFLLQGVPDVGPVRELRVGTDGSGLFPAWLLQTVELQDLKRPDAPATVFPCEKWISAANGHERILWARE